MRATNEELQSANEELQSTNEELQSANEELTTSKEEMQSMNEELQTINAELQTKLDDLALAQSDMQNLLNSTEIAIAVPGPASERQTLYRSSVEIVNVRESDVGRPLSDLTTACNTPPCMRMLSKHCARWLFPKSRSRPTTAGGFRCASCRTAGSTT